MLKSSANVESQASVSGSRTRLILDSSSIAPSRMTAVAGKTRCLRGDQRERNASIHEPSMYQPDWNCQYETQSFELIITKGALMAKKASPMPPANLSASLALRRLKSSPIAGAAVTMFEAAERPYRTLEKVCLPSRNILSPSIVK